MQSDGCYSSGFVLITRQKHLQYVKKLQWYTYLVIKDYILYFLLVSNKFKKFCLKNCFHLSLLGTYFSDVKSVYRSIEQGQNKFQTKMCTLWCQIDFLIICNFFWSSHFLIRCQTKVLLYWIHISLGSKWKNLGSGVLILVAFTASHATYYNIP